MQVNVHRAEACEVNERSRITEKHLEIGFALVIRPLRVILGVFFVRSSVKPHIDIWVSEKSNVCVCVCVCV